MQYIQRDKEAYGIMISTKLIINPQASLSRWIIALYSINLYIGITLSNSSALSISVLLIFVIQLVNGELLLKANFLSYVLPFGLSTVKIPLTTIYVSL